MQHPWRFVFCVVLLCALLTKAADAELVYTATPGANYQPLAGAQVRGLVNVRQLPCVAPVEFKVDGVVKNAEGGCPADLLGDDRLFDTATLTEGQHVIAAAPDSATFTVDNVPDVPPPTLIGPIITAMAWQPIEVAPGGSATLTWVAAADSCTSSWGAAIEPAGSTTLIPTAVRTDYTITCQREGIVKTATGTLHVMAPARAPLPANWPLKLKANLEGGPNGTYVLFWATDAPRGVSHYALYFNWARAADWAGRGLLTQAEYDVAYGEQSKTMTPEERAYAFDGPTSLKVRFGVRAVAAVNGTSLSRPVYASNANGTRNTTAVASARVAVGAACNVGDRLIDALGKGTKYYSVEGQDNVGTPAVDVLGRVFAFCDRTDPIGVN